MKKFSKAMTGVLITLMALAGHASALDVTIATGKEGGGYDRAASNLAQRLEQRDIDVDVENFAGSDEITLALCTDNANLGIAQIDAVDARAAEGCSLTPAGVYGEEIAVILFPPKSKHNELDDLDENSAILIDTIGSGTDLYWNTIKRIENGEHGNKSAWAKAKGVNEPIELAETSASFGEIDAVIMVRTPDSKDLQHLLNRGWDLGELHDKDIDDYEFNGASMYEGKKIRLKTASGKAKGYGYAVRSYYLVTAEVARDRKAFAVIAGAAR